jgi:hypothetical protein
VRGLLRAVDQRGGRLIPYRAAVRRATIPARAVLAAALVVVGLPALAVSQAPGTAALIPADAFRDVLAPVSAPRAPQVGPIAPEDRSAGFVEADGTFVEPDRPEQPIPTRAVVTQPGAGATEEWKPPRYSLTGEATFYDHGTTAMRLPRGTRIVVCGPAACLERVVTDYGPVKPSRIIDLYRPDFFAICGCPWYSGVINVTVHVY